MSNAKGHRMRQRRTAAENEELLARVAALEAAMRDIAESDDIENALDPARNKRIARAVMLGTAS